MHTNYVSGCSFTNSDMQVRTTRTFLVAHGSCLRANTHAFQSKLGKGAFSIVWVHHEPGFQPKAIFIDYSLMKLSSVGTKMETELKGANRGNGLASIIHSLVWSTAKQRSTREGKMDYTAEKWPESKPGREGDGRVLGVLIDPVWLLSVSHAACCTQRHACCPALCLYAIKTDLEA